MDQDDKRGNQAQSPDLVLPSSPNGYMVGGPDSQGRTIRHIFAKEDQFVVYSIGWGNVSFHLRDLPDRLRPAIAEANRLQLLWKTELRDAYPIEVGHLIARSLVGALRSSESEDPLQHFEEVRRSFQERGPVRQGYGKGPDYIVWRERSGRVTYYSESLNAAREKAVIEFSRLQNLAEYSLPKRCLEEARQQLGTELASIFAQGGQADASVYFTQAREYIEKRCQTAIQSKYIMCPAIASLFLAAVISTALSRVPDSAETTHELLWGGLAGVMGAFISVAQRAQKISYERFLSSVHMALLGVLRIFLGTIFGVLCVIAIKANLLVGLAQNNDFSLFIFSVAAGFSESFVPDLLSSIADREKKYDMPGADSASGHTKSLQRNERRP